MKKYLLTTAIILTTFSSNATEYKPYVGAEYQFIDADLTTANGINYNDYYANKYHAIAPYAGVRIDNYLGLEVGFSRSLEETKTSNISTIDTLITAYTVDALGYLPLDANKKVELVGSFGVGQYQVEYKASANNTTINGDMDTTALRLGLGTQYNINNKFNIRAMVRYADLNLDTVSSATSYSIGTAYTF